MGGGCGGSNSIVFFWVVACPSERGGSQLEQNFRAKEQTDKKMDVLVVSILQKEVRICPEAAKNESLTENRKCVKMKNSPEKKIKATKPRNQKHKQLSKVAYPTSQGRGGPVLQGL